MFGIFGKKEPPNESFNNLVIASLGELARSKIMSPTEDQFLKIVVNIASTQNFKLSVQQINAVKICAISMNMSVGDEIYILASKMIIEMPYGKVAGYENLKDLLMTHGILQSDEAINFAKNLAAGKY
jgi:hypothetical protein